MCDIAASTWRLPSCSEKLPWPGKSCVNSSSAMRFTVAMDSSSEQSQMFWRMIRPARKEGHRR